MRRNLKIAGISAMLALLSAMPGSAEPAKVLRIVTAGGEWTDAVQKCVDKAFTEKYGITIDTVTPSGFAKLAGLVQSGNVNAALQDLDSTELERGVAQNLLDPIDWDKVNPMPMFPEAKNKYGFASTYSSTLMAWRSDAKAPKTWVDFFDTVNFPGKRGLPDYPSYILPMAALADGVELSKLYPLDLDRAFKSLERIKADTVWWTSGAQAPQLLRDNEVQYSVAWSGRVVTKPELSHTFNQAQLNTSLWVVPKGADEAMKEAAWLYLHEYSDPKNQACITQYIPYTGPSPELDGILPKDKLSLFSTYKPNKDVQFVDDTKWWYDNAEAVEKRWQEFKLAQ